MNQKEKILNWGTLMKEGIKIIIDWQVSKFQKHNSDLIWRIASKEERWNKVIVWKES